MTETVRKWTEPNTQTRDGSIHPWERYAPFILCTRQAKIPENTEAMESSINSESERSSMSLLTVDNWFFHIFLSHLFTISCLAFSSNYDENWSREHFKTNVSWCLQCVSSQKIPNFYWVKLGGFSPAVAPVGVVAGCEGCPTPAAPYSGQEAEDAISCSAHCKWGSLAARIVIFPAALHKINGYIYGCSSY